MIFALSVLFAGLTVCVATLLRIAGTLERIATAIDKQNEILEGPDESESPRAELDAPESAR